jgi:hypothetical protein
MPNSPPNTGWLSLRSLTSTRLAVAVFVAALVLVYGALPLVVSLLFLPNPYFIELAQLTLVAGVAIVLGYQLPLFDHRFHPSAPRVRIAFLAFHATVWISFIVFLLITFATADAIPILSALKGANTAELSQQRGDFLKSREGAEVALLYISTIFVGALLPYSLAALFLQKSRYRFVLMALFLAFSVSFLAKALFVNVMLPLMYVFAQRSRASGKHVLTIILASVILLYAVTLLSFGGQSEFETGGAVAGAFFGAEYLPTGAVDHLIWRAVAVPMFTAADTLLVFADQFNREPMWGATSSFLAALFGLERIPLERLVFQQQWGWNDIANSNSVYITEGFANFSWFGVVLFSLFVGQSMRWFRRSRDEAFKSLWMIYCLTLFSSGLIGTMLSLGYALMFSLALFCKVQPGTLRKKTSNFPDLRGTSQRRVIQPPVGPNT